MDFVSGIFTTLGLIVTQFVTLMTSIFSSVVDIFYTPGAGEVPGELTIVGVLLLISLGSGLVIWGFNFIRNLIKVKL